MCVWTNFLFVRNVSERIVFIVEPSCVLITAYIDFQWIGFTALCVYHWTLQQYTTDLFSRFLNMCGFYYEPTNFLLRFGPRIKWLPMESPPPPHRFSFHSNIRIVREIMFTHSNCRSKLACAIFLTIYIIFFCKSLVQTRMRFERKTTQRVYINVKHVELN